MFESKNCGVQVSVSHLRRHHTYFGFDRLNYAGSYISDCGLTSGGRQCKLYRPSRADSKFARAKASAEVAHMMCVQLLLVIEV